MVATDDRRSIRFWRPDTASVTGMFRVEAEDRLRTTFAEHYFVIVVYAGAFDGWYGGDVRTHVAGAIKLKEPGEVHRDLRVHAPFTIQGASLSTELVTTAAAALGVRGPVRFKASGFGPETRASRLAFAMHAALVRDDVPALERDALVVDTLAEVLDGSPSTAVRGGARRAVRLARAFLHDALADKITLDQLAHHAGLDKFHLVRAFRAEVGVPPYEYLTLARIAKAKALLQRGALVAEAAQAVGFYDESQLHRHFRRIVGITPGRFARSFTRNGQHRPRRSAARDACSAHDSIESY